MLDATNLFFVPLLEGVFKEVLLHNFPRHILARYNFFLSLILNILKSSKDGKESHILHTEWFNEKTLKILTL